MHCHLQTCNLGSSTTQRLKKWFTLYEKNLRISLSNIVKLEWLWISEMASKQYTELLSWILFTLINRCLCLAFGALLISLTVNSLNFILAAQVLPFHSNIVEWRRRKPRGSAFIHAVCNCNSTATLISQWHSSQSQSLSGWLHSHWSTKWCYCCFSNTLSISSEIQPHNTLDEVCIRLFSRFNCITLQTFWTPTVALRTTHSHFCTHSSIWNTHCDWNTAKDASCIGHWNNCIYDIIALIDNDTTGINWQLIWKQPNLRIAMTGSKLLQCLSSSLWLIVNFNLQFVCVSICCLMIPQCFNSMHLQIRSS